VKQFLSRQARHAVSAVTLYELIAGVAGGDYIHFKENQQRLKVLCEPANTKYLPLPRDFLRQTVFGLEAPPIRPPRDLPTLPSEVKRFGILLHY
jgi:hypothetical protein